MMKEKEEIIMAVCPRCKKEVSEAYPFCPFCNSEIYPAESGMVEDPKKVEPETPAGRLLTLSEDTDSDFMAKVLGVIGWVNIVAGIIGCIWLAYLFSESPVEFGIPILIGAFFASVSSGCLFLGLKRVLMNQQDMMGMLKRVRYDREKKE